MKFLVALVITSICLAVSPVCAGTFSIENIHLHSQSDNIHEGIMISCGSAQQAKIFIPQVEVEIMASEDAESKNLFAKAYYYDGSGKLIQTLAQPLEAEHHVNDGVGRDTRVYIWPAILPKDKRISIYFPFPTNLPTNWTLVVVFGNANGAVAATFPDDQAQNLDYPEQALVAKTLLSPDVEINHIDQQTQLVEQVVQSDNSRYPAFTLLMHLPHGVTSAKDVKGVLAVCVVADSVGQIRDRLNSIKPQGDPDPYYAYAEAHGFAVIAWGARWVWSSYANFDQLDQNQVRAWDDNFQTLANAWDRGIDLLVNKYGIPDHDYLMYGLSAGGEWAHRLALHKPGRFLAVQMHISTSYDVPTPEANQVMWLLTTGELDSGCDNARKFYTTARDLGYPIIFKAIIGLSHQDSPIADQLGIRFFDYALAMKNRREAANVDDLTRSQTVDLSAFTSSPFYGDLMNQEIFTAHDKQMVPSDFLVPLPTRDIAEAWNK